MQKVMFDDRRGLTDAVIKGDKTQTRRDELNPNGRHTEEDWQFINALYNEGQDPTVQFDGENTFMISVPGGLALFKTRYKVGEIVAVAMSYKDAGYLPDEKIGWCYDENEDTADVLAKEVAGWNNKMFVRAHLMPHQIQITGIRIERLQSICDCDCLKEGIHKYTKDGTVFKYDLGDGFEMFKWFDMPRNPREAYSVLIDKVSGRGTWKRNPWVVVYDFKLVK